MRLFTDRDDAGRQLGRAVRERGYTRAVVLGIPRGGVVPAAEVARAIDGELGVVVARKLRAPYQPELGIGAITADGVAWVNDELAAATGATEAYLEKEKAAQAAEAVRREAAFDGARRPPVKGRDVIVVDDGVATGATVIAAVHALRAAEAGKVIVAVPVGSPQALNHLRGIADDVVALEETDDFYAIGQFYRDFAQVEDAEVRRALDEFRAGREASGRSVIEARVARADGELAVRLVTPAARAPWPAVVVVHGLGSSKESPRNVVIAERLVDSGIAAVLFDLSGHGESTASGSTIHDFADDLGAVVAWAARQPGIDPSRFGLMGASLGGLAVALAVRRGTVRPKAVVLRAPPADGAMLAGLGGETLILVGEADSLRPQVEEAAKATPGASIEVIPGAGHLFEEPGTLERAAELTLDWFAGRLLQ